MDRRTWIAIDWFRRKQRRKKVVDNGKNLLMKQGLATPRGDTAFWSVLDSRATPLSDGKLKIDTTGTTGNCNFWVKIAGAYNLKANTQYTLFVEFENVGENNASPLVLSQYTQLADPWTTSSNIPAIDIKNGAIQKKLLTTKDILTENMMCLRMYVSSTLVSNFTFRMMILEGDYTNTEISYRGFDDTNLDVNDIF